MTQAPQTPAPASTTPPAPVAPAENGRATAGMILGIITPAISWTALFIFPCVLPLGTGIAALILSILGRRTAKANGVGAGKAKAGLILGIVGLALTIVFLIWAVILMMHMMEMNRWSQDLWERTKQGGPGEFDPSQL